MKKPIATIVSRTAGIVAICGCLGACVTTPRDAPDLAAAVLVNDIADRYYTHTLATSPETAYFSGIKLERHDGMQDNSATARAAARLAIDELLASLRRVDAGTLIGTPEWITHAYLLQTLVSSVETRVCRTDLWNVNQMGGWHSAYPQLATLQPIGTPELREQSLVRWAKFEGYVRNEIAHLKEGLAQGYSAPQPVVQRVIDQVDGLLALPAEESPFYSPATRDNDAAFAAATRRLVLESIYPALRAYRDYLSASYLPVAREALSVTANPNGLACYEASLRRYTTLDRSGRAVFALGQEVVAANRAAIERFGDQIYGTSAFSTIVAQARSDPADKFGSAEELLAFSRETVRRAETAMPGWVLTMPAQPVEVVPFEAYEEGTGRSAHYNAATGDRPGEYRIPLHAPGEQSRGGAETTAFHETWPGHHLQVAVSQSVAGLHPVTQIIWFSGPGEGWARYSEALAEEMGLYSTRAGPILRRAWPARGMVVDPGLHLFGWTREQAIAFMRESGRFQGERADDMVDRIAILPGQLTAYDSGGLEILALRRQAEAALGEAFDIREFHDRVLENGTIPLRALREHIERWIAEKAAR